MARQQSPWWSLFGFGGKKLAIVFLLLVVFLCVWGIVVFTRMALGDEALHGGDSVALIINTALGLILLPAGVAMFKNSRESGPR